MIMFLKIFRIAAIVFLILWMVLIFLLSAETSGESSQTSGVFIEKVISIVISGFNELDEIEREETVASFQHIVRKSAHFTIYGILGFLSFLSFISYIKLSFKVRVVISSAVCLFYAVFDEIHQLFVSGRSGEVRDVCIDFSGAISAILICILIVLLNTRLKSILIKTEKTV